MPFTFKSSVISAHELTIGDDEDISNLAALVRPDPSGFVLIKHIRFAEFMYGADVQGEWPIPKVSAESTATEAQESYTAWRQLPRGFATQWKAELERAESAGKNG